MKALTTSMIVALFTVACGSTPSNNESDLNGRGGQPKNVLGDEVASTKGYISEVLHLMGHSTPQDPGYTKTVVVLEIPHGCLDKFASASHTVSYSDNKAIIDIAAFNYIDLKSQAVMCTQELKAEKKTIQLNGFFTEETITVNWLTAPSVAVKKSDRGVYAINEVRVVEAAEICPQIEGRASCRAVGSTIKINLPLNGCVDRLANVVTKIEPLTNRKARLTISALGMTNEASARSRCITAPTANHTIKTGFPVADAASLEVVVLK